MLSLKTVYVSPLYPYEEKSLISLTVHFEAQSDIKNKNIDINNVLNEN